MDMITRIDNSEDKNGTAQYNVLATTGSGALKTKIGERVVRLPLAKASFEQFVEALGGERVVRSLAMDAKMVQIRASIRQEALKGSTNGTKGSNGLD